MILAFVSVRFTFVARFLQVKVKLAFGFAPPLPDGPHLLRGGVSPVLCRCG
jgi:hypothetical protein